MGPLLRLAAEVVGDLTRAVQVYICLWSHGPAHIHFIVQPETHEIVEVLRRRFPSIEGPEKEDICYATSNRQWAVKEMLGEPYAFRK